MAFDMVLSDLHIDKQVVESKLNNIWVGSFKIRANLSRFERETMRRTLRVEKAVPKRNGELKMEREAPKRNDANHTWRKLDVSYAQMVRNQTISENIQGDKTLTQLFV